jgi:hypothetical protein
VELAVDAEAFRLAQEMGQRLVKDLFDGQNNWDHVWMKLSDTRQNLPNLRQSDYTRAMLWHQSNRSTEYFSKWIELKEQPQQRDNDR